MIRLYFFIEIISNDDSILYENAIKKANTKINQINNRLHLLKGLAVVVKTIKEVLELTTDDMKQMLKFFP